MPKRLVIELADDEFSESSERFGAKNVGYEILKAFRADQKRRRNIEAAKEAKRARNC